MGERGEYADKSKELKTKEAKNIDDNRLKEPPKNPDSKRDNGVIEDPNKQTRTQEKETTAVARNSKRQNEKESKKDDKKQNERKNVVIIGDSILNSADFTEQADVYRIKSYSTLNFSSIAKQQFLLQTRKVSQALKIPA